MIELGVIASHSAGVHDATLLELAALATRLEDPDEALDRVLRLIAADLEAANGSVALLSPDSGQLEIGARYHLPADRDQPSAPGQGLGGRAVFHGKPLLAAEGMAAPLASADGLSVGVIELERPGRPFQEADLERLARLSDEAGRVMQRLWQLDHLRDKARQLETLLGAGQSFVSKLDEEALVAALTRDAQRLMQARACALYLYDSGSSAVRFGGASGIGRPSPDAFPLDSSFVAASIRTGKPVAFADIQSPEYFDLADIPRDPALRSALTVPLLFEGEALGVLAVFVDRPRRFDDDEKRLCQALASLGAGALENARLYARVFQSEEVLRKNERLTTLGLMSAEIAHEIRNPLTVLKLLHGGLGADFPEGDPRRTDLRIIGEKLDQLESIVSRVLSFGRSPSRLHSRCSLQDIVEDTLVLVRLKLAQSKIGLRSDAPLQPLTVEGNKGELQQALFNLLLNAVDAMPQGGEVRLAVGAENSSSGAIGFVAVSDTGGGIPDAIRDRIFEPFLSGRPDGTGLGLAIARRLLADHHGDVELAATGPAGTTFRMILPLAKSQ